MLSTDLGEELVFNDHGDDGGGASYNDGGGDVDSKIVLVIVTIV
jgi:hypothetical protein